MKIGKIPRLHRDAVSPVIYGLAGTYLIDVNEVSVTTPEATLMSQTIPLSLFTSVGVCVEVESWLRISGGGTLYFDIDGTLITNLTVGSVSIRHRILIVKRASDYLYQSRAEYLSAPNTSSTDTLSPGGSSLSLLYRGTNTTQRLMRTTVHAL